MSGKRNRHKFILFDQRLPLCAECRMPRVHPLHVVGAEDLGNPAKRWSPDEELLLDCEAEIEGPPEDLKSLQTAK